MTETERKALALALALVNEVRDDLGYDPVGITVVDRKLPPFEAVCRAIEQHEAFRQEVSDAVEAFMPGTKHQEAYLNYAQHFARFIIAKPDPLVEALNDMKDGRAGPTTESYAACLRAALAARGLKIVEVGHE